MNMISKLKAIDDEYRPLYGQLIRPEFWIAMLLIISPLAGAGFVLEPAQANLAFPFIMLALFGGMFSIKFMGMALDKVEDGA